MLFDGKAIQVEVIDNIAHFTFNAKESGANVIGSLATGELSEALAKIKSSNAKGVLYKSNKEHFIFGADITEFMGHFKKSHEELKILSPCQLHQYLVYPHPEMPRLVRRAAQNQL